MGEGYNRDREDPEKAARGDMEIQKSGITPNSKIQNFAKKIYGIYLRDKYLKIKGLTSIHST
jgi:hypothetical protein